MNGVGTIVKIDIKKGEINKGENAGFSLVEITVVVVVLGILSAIAIPSYLCSQRRSKSTAAQVAIRSIKKECQANFAYGLPDIFTSHTLKSYEIISSGGPYSCNGVVSVIPTDRNLLPSYKYQSSDQKISYTFRGQTGTSFIECNKLICDRSNYTQDDKQEETLKKPSNSTVSGKPWCSSGAKGQLVARWNSKKPYWYRDGVEKPRRIYSWCPDDQSPCIPDWEPCTDNKFQIYNWRCDNGMCCDARGEMNSMMSFIKKRCKGKIITD